MSLKVGHQLLALDRGKVEVQLLLPDDPSDTAIVLLHEGLGAISMWKDFPARLCAITGFQVVVYSRFGFGQSSPCELPRPLDYMEYEAQQPLPRLLNHVEANRLFLLGHSDGASIAAIYAGSVADVRLGGIMLIAPHFFTEKIAIKQIQLAATAYNQGDLREKLKRHHGANVDIAFRGWNDAWLNPDFWQWDITQYLPKIQVPALLIQGSEDQYGTAKHLQIAQQKIPSRVEVQILPDLHHSPHLEQPEEVLHLVQRFCQEVLQTPL